MKREQVVKWLESKGKVEEVMDKDDKWDTLTFKAMIGLKGEFVNFVGEADVRCSVFPEMVIMTIRNHRWEEVACTFYFDGCHKDRFENETVTVEFL
jgi:hypothetical protein